jgi:hypothetical protein
MEYEARRWCRKKQKPALPTPTTEDILNLRRLVDHPEDFDIQDPESLRQPQILRNGTRSVAFRNSNPDRHRIREGTFVILGWCKSDRQHGPGYPKCSRPHPTVILLVVSNLRADWVKVKLLYNWNEMSSALVPAPCCLTETNVFESASTKHLLWVRARRNPFFGWSLVKHQHAPKQIRRAVLCIMCIWRLEVDHMLGALPRELLYLLFEAAFAAELDPLAPDH